MRGVSSAVRFITSLLALYPEIGAVRLEDDGTTIIFEFYLKQSLVSSMSDRKRDIINAYNVFSFASGIKMSCCVIDKVRDNSRSTQSMSDDGAPKVNPNSYADSPELSRAVDSYCAFFVERDIVSLSYEEISMLMALVSDEFNSALVRSKCSAIGEDTESSVQQLRHNLDLFREEVRTNVDEDGEQIESIPDILGYCDDMRIVVSYATTAKSAKKKKPKGSDLSKNVSDTGNKGADIDGKLSESGKQNSGADKKVPNGVKMVPNASELK